MESGSESAASGLVVEAGGGEGGDGAGGRRDSAARRPSTASKKSPGPVEPGKLVVRRGVLAPTVESLGPDVSAPIVVVPTDGSRPTVWAVFRRVDALATGFVKHEALVDTGARRSSVSYRVSDSLKSLPRGTKVTKTATGVVSRELVILRVSTGSKFDRLAKEWKHVSSSVELTCSVRDKEAVITTSLLGMDWLAAARPIFAYKV